MSLGTEVGLGPDNIVLDGDSAPLLKKGQCPLQFSAHFYCGQSARCIKMPLGTEVDLGPGHIVLDGVPALRESGTAALLFSTHVCHGSSSELVAELLLNTPTSAKRMQKIQRHSFIACRRC